MSWDKMTTPNPQAHLLQRLSVCCSSKTICVNGVKIMTSNWINMNPFPASQFVALESHMSFLQAEESVILAHTDVISRVEARSSLANNDVSWFHFLEN